jgi:hypothetical protein
VHLEIVVVAVKIIIGVKSKTEKENTIVSWRWNFSSPDLIIQKLV